MGAPFVVGVGPDGVDEDVEGTVAVAIFLARGSDEIA